MLNQWLSRRPRLAGPFSLGLIAAGLLLLPAILAFGYMRTCGFAGCPTTAELQSFRPSEGSRILDRNGVLLGRLTHVRRLNVPLSRVPKHVRAAFLAVEDRRFYFHHGVDWRSAGRAAWRNLRSLEVREGFSTITMQVVRNAFLPHLSSQRTLRRKLIELELARRLERALPKQRILELYLNVIYLGNGTYGVEAASRDLFGKSVERLSVGEAATLAGIARGPSLYAPRRHPERATARRDLALLLMAREGYITSARADGARAEPLRIARDGWRPRREPSHALDPVRELVDSVLGDAGGVGDLVVYTTLDARAQRAAERAVSDRAAAIERAAGPRYAREGESLEGALVALDTRQRRGSRAGRGAPAGAAGLQPCARRPPSTGLGLQAVRLRGGSRRGVHSGLGDR